MSATVNINEDLLPAGGLEDAELACGLAQRIVRRLHNDPQECDIAGAEALIGKARLILNRRITQDPKGRQVSKPDA